MKKISSLLFLLVVLVSCNEESVNSDEISALETDELSVEVALEEAEVVLDNIVLYSESSFGVEASETSKSISTSEDSKSGKRGRSGFFKNCADITVEELDDVVTTTIIFNQGCEDHEGNEITGTIIKVKSKTDTSKERSITIEDLSINGRVVNGTKTYTFTKSNANGNPEMIGSVNISVETEDGIKTKVGTRTIEVTAGGDTDTHKDDEKTITGSSEYTNKEGEILSVNITTPLVKPAACRYIASGVKEYTREAGTTTIDFGDGTCDNVATKTAPDGTVTEVKLRKKRKR